MLKRVFSCLAGILFFGLAFSQDVPLENQPALPGKEEYGAFDIQEPLLLEGKGRLFPKVEYYSCFFNRIPQYDGGIISFIKDTVQKRVGFRIINRPLLELFKLAFGKSPFGIFNNKNRVIIEAENKIPLETPGKGDSAGWFNKYLFSYEISLPIAREQELFKFMQDDLNRWFPFTVKVEKRNSECLTLVRTTWKDYIASRGGKPVFLDKDNRFEIKNQVLKNTLLPVLEYKLSSLSLPIVDSTNYQSKADLILEGDLSDLANVKKQLKNFGLDIIRKKIDVEMLVIKDKK